MQGIFFNHIRVITTEDMNVDGRVRSPQASCELLIFNGGDEVALGTNHIKQGKLRFEIRFL